MKSYIILNKKKLKPLPKEFSCDGRFDPNLIKYLINNFSKVNDKIIDPFMGFGTVVSVGENMNRVCWGVEKDPDRFKFSLKNIHNKNNVLCNDIMRVTKKELPDFDLCISSPTFSWINMGYNPFDEKKSHMAYYDYLNQIRVFYKKISSFMKKDSTIIVDTSNIIVDGINTTLAWDIKNVINSIKGLHFIKEIVICWSNEEKGYKGGSYEFGYDHSYCLIFKKY